MAGNVWEWTSSLYEPYPYRVADGREDLDAGGTRVLRGGSFLDAAADVRCAARYEGDPGTGDGNNGSRVCVVQWPD